MMRSYPERYLNVREVFPKKIFFRTETICPPPVRIPAVRKRESKGKGIKRRDREVFRLHSQGKSVKQISRKMLLSKKCKKRVKRIINNGAPKNGC